MAVVSATDKWRVPVTRLRSTPAGLDQWGDPVPGPWVETALPDALFAPGGTSEPVQPGTAAVVSTPTVYWRGQWPDIGPADRLSVDGTVWQVEGRPARWPLGMAVTLKAVEAKE